jgi:predicted deacylase
MQIETHNGKYLQYYVLDTGIPGPTYFATGRVHGKEPAGEKGISKLLQTVQAGEINLKNGRLVCVPRANRRASILNLREADKNMNRGMLERAMLEVTSTVRPYEIRVQAELKALMKSEADLAHNEGQEIFCQDLHTTTAPSDPYVPRGTLSDWEHRMAMAVGAWCVISNLEEAADVEPGSIGMVVDYARSLGAHAQLLECGQHDDPRAGEVAFESAVRAMASIGMLDLPSHMQPYTDLPTYLRYKKIAEMGTGCTDLKFFDGLINGSPIQEGQPLATLRDASGKIQTLYSENNGVLIMPRNGCPPREETHYECSDDPVLQMIAKHVAGAPAIVHPARGQILVAAK